LCRHNKKRLIYHEPPKDNQLYWSIKILTHDIFDFFTTMPALAKIEARVKAKVKSICCKNLSIHDYNIL